MFHRESLMRKDIVHVDNLEGHRKAYLDLLANIVDFDKLVQPISRGNFLALVTARKLLFATVGVAFRRYFLVCLFRALLNKPSVSLFLGANRHYHKKGFDVDLMLLKIWKGLPKQRIVSIISLNVLSELSKVTNGYIYDPQLWDIWSEKAKIFALNTTLSEQVNNEKSGRKTLIYIGKGKKGKSFIEFADFVLANSQEVYGVVAGKVLSECQDKADQLKAKGMIVADRYVSDEEIFSLYAQADLVWCYYSPVYDQSSGVFGRAIQLGIPAIVRKGSIVEKIANDLGVLAYSIEILPSVNYKSIFNQIKQLDLSLLTEEERCKLFSKLENESIQKLADALRIAIYDEKEVSSVSNN